jgi:hypothetical protein
MLINISALISAVTTLQKILKQGVDCLQKLEQCEKVKNSESMRPDNL